MFGKRKRRKHVEIPIRSVKRDIDMTEIFERINALFDQDPELHETENDYANKKGDTNYENDGDFCCAGN